MGDNECAVRVGDKEKKTVSRLNNEIYVKAEEILLENLLSGHIGWHGLSIFIDYLESNYNISRR
ncbi:MAG: hypothetical protein DRP02_14040 [Candidatus Gerdarchaeota archaeon]|nr:MAG: hypothetical protein DRP02_14040 [Candidatus Gerdarchaeota archaeon]